MPDAMWESERAARTTPALWVPILLGLAIAFAQVSLVAAAWDACRIDGATGLTASSLYALGVPALTFLNWLLLALPAEVYMSKRTPALNRWAMTILTSSVLIAAETLVLAYYVATPAEPVSTRCVDNVPDWWPNQIPV